ncbi:DUF1816 domain-containing protein [Aetokthonos hydrillicola Thurmond2011]|jgi:hypothetical protein|uniref:DUF1816 domain-containing protein n=1 Tax=Aetokthonos hydrillicola Thurmond2011 TaxID=2712845 RepID=A0AAP5M835_9CYAN|nr:DUF1816 domain-containing protein [Aetokthonos hydrillicola]MBO3463189.1 DUF1816 domain-containing protein [Aetokthonos hydrillicola CCALA 1050]MBW4589563.1 DUF1816 domain-containing protein [Aetokthonos hydrillicola CCALA 1050]MDR9893163.1 DUF1816 domain-containing protein [Aetokthonos hydrillicola Thurmond2011]
MRSAQIIQKPLQFAWWIEISTQVPCCTYYFGPFSSAEEAHLAQSGYIEDLVEEGAQGITFLINRCKPLYLTIFDDECTLSSELKESKEF